MEDSQEKSKEKKFELKKRVGLWSGVALTISAMIGSGIFVTPTGVLKSVHGSVGMSLIIWVACGFVALSSCLCYCELGMSLKASGEDFLNFKLVYGPLVSSIYMWSNVVLRPAGAAASYQIFSTYLISPILGDCDLPESAIKLVAIALLLFLSFLNYVSVKMSVKFEIVFTAAKFLALTLIAVVGIVNLASGNPVGLNNFAKSFDSMTVSKLQITDISQGFYQGLFAYSGYSALIQITEEIKDVSRNLHRAALLAFFGVMLIYLLVNIGYFSVLTPEEMIQSKAVAEAFGSRALGIVSWLIPLSVCLSTVGHLNGVVLLVARSLFVLARDGYAPKIFEMIHVKYYTPASSILLCCVVKIIYIIIGDFDILINSFSFYRWTCQGLSAVSVLLMRRKYPNLHRPYKAPIVCPIFSTVISIYFVVTPFIQNPNPIYFLVVGFFVLSAFMYYIFIVRSLEIPGFQTASYSIQKLLQVAETDWENYSEIQKAENEKTF